MLELWRRGLDLLFPPRCAGCQQSGHLLCPSCWQTMQPLTMPLCHRCGTPLSSPSAQCLSCQNRRLELHGLRSVHLFQGPLRHAIHMLKYKGQQRVAGPLGLLLAQAFMHYDLQADGIIPLPLHEQREQERGYNQATLLASICASHLKIPCLDKFVIRQRATRAQIGLNAQERRQNVAGAFALAPGASTHLHRYHTLVLIDDVCTSGATLEACAMPLYLAGVQEIWGLVLARPL